MNRSFIITFAPFNSLKTYEELNPPVMIRRQP